jgi:hypothetical protein
MEALGFGQKGGNTHSKRQARAQHGLLSQIWFNLPARNYMVILSTLCNCTDYLLQNRKYLHSVLGNDSVPSVTSIVKHFTN